MKLKALFILIALLIAISHTALAGSMESNLAGSWMGAAGSTATYAKVKGKEFSGVLSAVLPYFMLPQNFAPVGFDESQQPVMELSYNFV